MELIKTIHIKNLSIKELFGDDYDKDDKITEKMFLTMARSVLHHPRRNEIEEAYSMLKLSKNKYYSIKDF